MKTIGHLHYFTNCGGRVAFRYLDIISSKISSDCKSWKCLYLLMPVCRLGGVSSDCPRLSVPRMSTESRPRFLLRSQSGAEDTHAVTIHCTGYRVSHYTVHTTGC